MNPASTMVEIIVTGLSVFLVPGQMNKPADEIPPTHLLLPNFRHHDHVAWILLPEAQVKADEDGICVPFSPGACIVRLDGREIELVEWNGNGLDIRSDCNKDTYSETPDLFCNGRDPHWIVASDALLNGPSRLAGQFNPNEPDPKAVAGLMPLKGGRLLTNYLSEHVWKFPRGKDYQQVTAQEAVILATVQQAEATLRLSRLDKRGKPSTIQLGPDTHGRWKHLMVRIGNTPEHEILTSPFPISRSPDEHFGHYKELLAEMQPGGTLGRDRWPIPTSGQAWNRPKMDILSMVSPRTGNCPPLRLVYSEIGKPTSKSPTQTVEWVE